MQQLNLFSYARLTSQDALQQTIATMPSTTCWALVAIDVLGVPVYANWAPNAAIRAQLITALQSCAQDLSAIVRTWESA